MKAFTDIEQSKQLAEILPIESADMRYGYTAPFEFSDIKYDGGYGSIPYHKNFFNRCSNLSSDECDRELPCWSLAALLSALPFYLIVNNQSYRFSMIKGFNNKGETYAIKYAVFNTILYLHLTDFYNNPIDACMEMIVKLKEKDLL